MPASQSRYKSTPKFTTEPGAVGGFRGLRPRALPLPRGIIEHTLSADDRLDQLASHYYNNDRLGWTILDANPQFLYGGELFPLKNELSAAAAMPESTSAFQPQAGATILIPQGRST